MTLANVKEGMGGVLDLSTVVEKFEWLCIEHSGLVFGEEVVSSESRI